MGFSFVRVSRNAIRNVSRASCFARWALFSGQAINSKDLTIYRQGDITYLLNAENRHAASCRRHGPCAPHGAGVSWTRNMRLNVL